MKSTKLSLSRVPRPGRTSSIRRSTELTCSHTSWLPSTSFRILPNKLFSLIFFFPGTPPGYPCPCWAPPLFARLPLYSV